MKAGRAPLILAALAQLLLFALMAPAAHAEGAAEMHYVDAELRPFPTAISGEGPPDNFLVQRFDRAIAAHENGRLATSGHQAGRELGAVLRLNRQRAAMLPQDLPSKFVLVDAANQTLSVYEDGLIAETMRVVVGRKDNATPMLAGLIRHAEIDPYWNIPPDMVREKLALRAIRRGPEWLTRAGYEVLPPIGEPERIMDPKTVDWRAVRSGTRQVRIRQKPGGANAMGTVKFMLPNRLGIYLHDTPQKHLMKKSSRLFSAGCVRLEDADGLARHLLDSTIAQARRTGVRRVELDKPIPVFITYFTAWPDGDTVEIRRDVYDRDQA